MTELRTQLTRVEYALANIAVSLADIATELNRMKEVFDEVRRDSNGV